MYFLRIINLLTADGNTTISPFVTFSPSTVGLAAKNSSRFLAIFFASRSETDLSFSFRIPLTLYIVGCGFLSGLVHPMCIGASGLLRFA